MPIAQYKRCRYAISGGLVILRGHAGRDGVIGLAPSHNFKSHRVILILGTGWLFFLYKLNYFFKLLISFSSISNVDSIFSNRIL